jgi:hypothetical protein
MMSLVVPDSRTVGLNVPPRAAKPGSRGIAAKLKVMLLPLFIAGVVTAGGEYVPPVMFNEMAGALLIVKRPVNTPPVMVMEPLPVVLLELRVTFCEVEKPAPIVIEQPGETVGETSPSTNARS